jgi:hypothetical protein
MNKDELKHYVDGIADDVEIIVITTKEQAAAMPRHCERIEVPPTGWTGAGVVCVG